MQTAIAILIVFACVVFVAKKLIGTLRTGTGKAGSCCSKGCGGEVAGQTPTASPEKPREQFIASDMLRKRR
jgi:hypothetical protein